MFRAVVTVVVLLQSPAIQFIWFRIQYQRRSKCIKCESEMSWARDKKTMKKRFWFVFFIYFIFSGIICIFYVVEAHSQREAGGNRLWINKICSARRFIP